MKSSSTYTWQRVRYYPVSAEGKVYEAPFVMLTAFNQNGDYIGDKRVAQFLTRLGIPYPEPMKKGSHMCSIGKSVKDGKWYGWSHRAYYGFQIGDTVKEGDCTATSGYIASYLAEHPEDDLSLPVGFVAKTEEDCKRMAIAFAESVS